MIENALIIVDPPRQMAVKKRLEKMRTPFEWYLRKLIYVDLDQHRLGVNDLQQVFVALPWGHQLHQQLWRRGSEDIAETRFVDVDKSVVRIFSQIWKVKYQNVQHMAELASLITRHNVKFGVQLVDNVLEQVRQGLEIGPKHKTYQGRMLTVKYLGELFNNRMISDHVVFEILYSLVFFAHANGKPVLDENPVCLLDPPNDYFRVRLICGLLESCGKSLNPTRLDHFLAFFQYYILTKDPQAIPLEVQFMIEDLFEGVRPNVKRITDYFEAAKKIEMLEKELTGSSEATSWAMKDSPVKVVTDKRIKGLADAPEVDYEGLFASEFQALLQEGLQSRRNDRVSNMDVAVPVRLATQPKAPSRSDEVEFSLLTKKSNKAALKTISVPSQSSIADSARSTKQLILKEKQELKTLILDYEVRSRAEEQNISTQK
jgi:regulator of nonsense transcripts 2